MASFNQFFMEPLIIQGTDDTPTVRLDPANDIFEISGRSLPEDVADFYKDILDWLTFYIQKPNEQTEFVFKLTYANTATSKILLDVFKLLEDMHERGHKINIIWFYEVDDEEMLEGGEEYREAFSMPFEMISVR